MTACGIPPASAGTGVSPVLPLNTGETPARAPRSPSTPLGRPFRASGTLRVCRFHRVCRHAAARSTSATKRPTNKMTASRTTPRTGRNSREPPAGDRDALWRGIARLGWPAPAAQTAHPAVVRVTALERGGASLGSGVLVAVDQSHGLVLTNWHVVRDAAGPILVSFPDGFTSGAVVLATDHTWDLAALAIWRPNVQPTPIATEPARPGDVLTIAGYGADSYRAVSGRCTEYLSPGGNNPPEIVEVNVAARQGDSGGPIFNARGEVAGVLFGANDSFLEGQYTMGSYCGRVRRFVASVGGDFQRLPASSTMIARQPPPAQPAASRGDCGRGRRRLGNPCRRRRFLRRRSRCRSTGKRSRIRRARPRRPPSRFRRAWRRRLPQPGRADQDDPRRRRRLCLVVSRRAVDRSDGGVGTSPRWSPSPSGRGLGCRANLRRSPFHGFRAFALRPSPRPSPGGRGGPLAVRPLSAG